jgi:hypothetical protein
MLKLFLTVLKTFPMASAHKIVPTTEANAVLVAGLWMVRMFFKLGHGHFLVLLSRQISIIGFYSPYNV